MMRMLFLFSLICTAGLAGASPPTPPVFSVHDLNRDGYLDRAEYATLQATCALRRGARGVAALERFDALDDDRDDRISEAELLQVLGRRYRGGRGEDGHSVPVQRNQYTP